MGRAADAGDLAGLRVHRAGGGDPPDRGVRRADRLQRRGGRPRRRRGVLVAGLICFWANRALVRAARRREAAARAEFDPENPLRAGGVADGETVHTLYFIPLWVWGWIYGIFGAF